MLIAIEVLSFLPAFLSNTNREVSRVETGNSSLPLSQLHSWQSKAFVSARQQVPPRAPALGYVGVISKCLSDLGSK